jgi:hypothetical protein
MGRGTGRAALGMRQEPDCQFGEQASPNVFRNGTVPALDGLIAGPSPLGKECPGRGGAVATDFEQREIRFGWSRGFEVARYESAERGWGRTVRLARPRS